MQNQPSNDENIGTQSEWIGTYSDSRDAFILHYLSENGGEATLGELSYELARSEARESDDIGEETVRHLRTLIQYIYIPILEDSDLIITREDGTIISLTDDRSSVSLTQGRLGDFRHWWVYYLLTGAGLAGTAAIYVLPLVAVPRTALRAAVLIAIIVLVAIGVGRYNEIYRHE